MPYQPMWLKNIQPAIIAVHVLRKDKLLRVGSGVFVSKNTAFTALSVVDGPSVELTLYSADGISRAARIIASSKSNNLALLKLDQGQGEVSSVVRSAGLQCKPYTPSIIYGYNDAESEFRHYGAVVYSTLASHRPCSVRRSVSRMQLSTSSPLDVSLLGAPVLNTVTGELESVITEGPWFIDHWTEKRRYLFFGACCPARRDLSWREKHNISCRKPRSQAARVRKGPYQELVHRLAVNIVIDCREQLTEPSRPPSSVLCYGIDVNLQKQKSAFYSCFLSRSDRLERISERARTNGYATVAECPSISAILASDDDMFLVTATRTLLDNAFEFGLEKIFIVFFPPEPQA